MGALFNSGLVSRIFLSSLLVAFSLASLSTPCYSQININATDIQFVYRMEQLIEKINKAKNKNDSNKVIDLMLDAKREIETYTGTSIN